MFYRPIPISWFTGAVVAQAVILSALLLIAVILLRASVPPIILAGALSSAYIFYRVWRGKLQTASFWWSLALVVIMLGQMSMFAFGCLSRAPCWEMAIRPAAECLDERQYIPYYREEATG